MWFREVWYKLNDVSKERSVSTFRIKELVEEANIYQQ
jgi:hypothetical protein